MKNYKFSDDEINFIVNALGQLPYLQVFQLINSVQKQFAEQEKIDIPIEEID